MQTDQVEARVSQLTPLFIKNESYDCPSGPVTWFTPKCPGHIAGQITDALTGDPVENIGVWFQGGTAGNAGYAFTNALGHYVIGPLESDQACSLVVQGQGYSYRILDDGALPDDGLVQNVEIVRVGSVEGKIRDSNGRAIHGAKVWLFREDVPRWGTAETTTDDEGNYHFCGVDVSSESNLNGSSYEISASHPDHSFIRSVVSVAAQSRQRSDKRRHNQVPPLREPAADGSRSPLLVRLLQLPSHHRQIGRITPYQAVCNWHQKQLELFHKEPTELLAYRSQAHGT